MSDLGSISDGYHTFDELYAHRIELFITLCRMIAYDAVFDNPVWRSEYHSDGTRFDDWFVLGIGYNKGRQITYHLPMIRWSDVEFAKTLERAPEWDGHSASDVLERLKRL